MLPFFEDHEIPLLRILTDRGTEFCGAREHHEYQLYLAVENIGHNKTNSICERFHKTIQDEFYQTPFCKKLSTTPKGSLAVSLHSQLPADVLQIAFAVRGQVDRLILIVTDGSNFSRPVAQA